LPLKPTSTSFNPAEPSKTLPPIHIFSHLQCHIPKTNSSSDSFATIKRKPTPLHPTHPQATPTSSLLTHTLLAPLLTHLIPIHHLYISTHHRIFNLSSLQTQHAPSTPHAPTKPATPSQTHVFSLRSSHQLTP
ncbi:uncharacterized protein K452DRAFT_160005, partial [Aplosporella prunicola CBS 121167]